jgi:hypothetical protein
MMGFGMGCCCLQITMQAFCIVEARKIYDQLVPFAPIAVRMSFVVSVSYLLDGPHCVHPDNEGISCGH